MKLNDFKTVSDIASAWFGLLALLAGGGFAVFQYLEKDKADRVKETLSYLERYNKSPILDARQRLLVAWRAHDAELVSSITKPTGSADEYRQLVLHVIETEALYLSIIPLVDFYDSLQVCSNAKVCDPATAKQFFLRDARTFYTLHYPLIEAERSGRKDPRFAVALEAFASAK